MTDDTRAREFEELFGIVKAWRDFPGAQLVQVRLSILRDITRALASPQDVGVERAALRQLVDTVWQAALEDQSVPDTPWADRMIDAALASAPAQPEQEEPQIGDRVDGVPGSPMDAAAEGAVFSAAQPEQKGPKMCAQCGGAGVSGPDQTCSLCNGSGAQPRYDSEISDEYLDAIRNLIQSSQGGEGK